MITIFDTETTGFPAQAPLDSPSQPHIVQLAAIQLDRDWTVRNQFSVLIYPEGFDSIPEKAQAVHGIRIQDLQSFGIPRKTALSMLVNMVKSSSRVIGHNLSFDTRLVQIAMARIQKECPIELVEFGFCTMQAMTDICRLPGRFPGKYKWPKLQEAYLHCYGKEFEKAHDALADVLATRDIFRWLIENGHAPAFA